MSYEIKKGRSAKAIKTVIYGIEGIGKSTFASKFPDPVFIDTEGSTQWMDVARFPQPTSFSMLMDEVKQVSSAPLMCQTLVIDTIDWAEKLAIAEVTAKAGKSGIEDFGYGQGYTYVYETFGKLMNALQECVDKGVNVVLTAHAAIRTFTKPDEMGVYDRYELKLINTPKVKITEMVKEWADMLLFANYKTILVKNNENDKKSFIAGGERYMYTQHAPAYDAKNRFGLKESLPFDYKQIEFLFGNELVHTEHVVTPAPKAEAKKAEQPKEDPATQIALNDPLRTVVVNASDFPAEFTEEDMKTISIMPKDLQDLMIGNKVSPKEIQKAVGSRGYYPEDMSIADYPLDFVSDCLVAAWPQVFEMVKEVRKQSY